MFISSYAIYSEKSLPKRAWSNFKIIAIRYCQLYFHSFTFNSLYSLWVIYITSSKRKIGKTKLDLKEKYIIYNLPLKLDLTPFPNAALPKPLYLVWS